jgi:hypothetical protein
MGSKVALSLVLAIPAVLFAQGDDPVAVFTEHPRLMLRPQRLRLLKRERERSSMRWQQFASLVTGSAPMPEPGFAWGLYYQVSGDAAYAKKAVEWALGPGSADLRQMALTFDWCQEAMSEAQSKELAARLQRALAEPPGNETASRERDRVFTAIALFDHVPQTPQRELDRAVRQWWTQRMVTALKSGRHVISRDDAYPLWELMHALRDSTNLDLRESVPKFFKEFPIEHLISHYPAIWQAPENEYRIGASVKTAEPEARSAALSRAAELAMVAMDVNAAESQVLQGWLMHDKFMLKSTFGAPYEFLWANPYQPGLSYYHVPLIFHSEEYGRLFVRSTWDPDADWFGYFDGAMQIFTDGKLTPLNPRLKAPPVSLVEAWLCFAQLQKKWELPVEDEVAVFVLGLEPKRVYRVEIDDEEMYEATSDAGGILVLDLPKGKTTGFRILG